MILRIYDLHHDVTEVVARRFELWLVEHELVWLAGGMERCAANFVFALIHRFALKRDGLEFSGRVWNGEFGFERVLFGETIRANFLAVQDKFDFVAAGVNAGVHGCVLETGTCLTDGCSDFAGGI